MELQSNTQRVLSSLISFFPGFGSRYIDVMREAGYTDDQIAAQCDRYIRNTPTMRDFVNALEKQIILVVAGLKPE